MSATWGMSFILMLLIGSGPNELLDLVPTEAYWQAQNVTVSAETMLAELKEERGGEPPDISALIQDLGAEQFTVREAAQKKILAAGPGVLAQLQPLLKSDDPEVVARAQEMIRQLSAGQRSRHVRRLMAIRTLGELKCTEALPALRRLAGSKELFVADHARQAAAAIQGRSLPRPSVPPEQRAKDAWLLPKECSLVAQFTTAPGTGKLDLAKALAGLGPMAGGDEPQRMIQQLLPPLLELADKIGNARVDCITLGVAGEISGNKGFVVVAVRGLYDAGRAAAALKETMRPGRSEVRRVGQLDVYLADREFAVIFASNELLVLISAPRQELMPIDAVAQAVTSGKGTLAENKELAALIEAADKSGPLWAAARMTEAYRKTHSMLAPLESAALTTRKTKDGLELSLRAAGSDAEKLATSVAEFNEVRKRALDEMGRAAREVPALKCMLDLIASIQVTQAGGQVTITGKLTGDAPAGLVLPMMLLSVHPRSAPRQTDVTTPRTRPARTSAVRTATTRPAKAPRD